MLCVPSGGLLSLAENPEKDQSGRSSERGGKKKESAFATPHTSQTSYMGQRAYGYEMTSPLSSPYPLCGESMSEWRFMPKTLKTKYHSRVLASTTGCLGVGLSFLHVTLGIVGPRIIQRFAFVTKQQRSETWPRRQVTGERNLRSQVDDMSSGERKSDSFIESRSSVARLNKCNAENILS